MFNLQGYDVKTIKHIIETEIKHSAVSSDKVRSFSLNAEEYGSDVIDNLLGIIYKRESVGEDAPKVLSDQDWNAGKPSDL